MDVREAIGQLVQEREMEAQMQQLCRLRRLLRYHTLRSEGSEPGFPDDLILLPDLPDDGLTLLAWELKTAKGEPTPAQLRWIEAFGRVERVDARILRPADMDWAVKVLTGKERIP